MWCKLAILSLFLGTVGAPSASNRTIYVSENAPPGGDGSLQHPFQTITDAIIRAHAIHGNAVIKVQPGTYSVSNTLDIEDDSVSLIASDFLETDSGGWPTGVVTPGTETLLAPSASLGSLALISVGHSSGTVVRNITIQGFTMTPRTGDGVDLFRAQDFTVAGNVIEGLPQTPAPVNFGINAEASSGTISGNFITQVACGTCVAAGYAGSPSFVQFIGNRVVQVRNAGLILSGSTILGVGPSIPEQGDQMHAVVRNNDISLNTSSSPVGFGIRVFMIMRAFPDTQSSGNVQALIQDNQIAGNYIGVGIDAGFPFRQIGSGAAKVCDTRVYSGRFDLTLQGNQIGNNLRAPGLISFTRFSATLTPAQLPQWQYLHQADFTIVDPQEELAGSIVDNPAMDPFVNSYCDADTMHEALGNSLRYNGRLVPESP
jgi:hypothetical protein